MYWQYGDNGGFTISVGDEEAEVTCEHNDETWLGGKEGGYVEPPYYVMVEMPDVAAAGAWTLSTWIIDRLLKPQ